MKSYGKNARTVLFVLAGLLALGVVGSLWMGHRATAKAQGLAIEQASTIADRTLTLVFQPSDLSRPVDDARALQLSQQITSTVIDPSDFADVTLYSPEGQILYSTQAGRIGNELVGEKDRIKEALKGTAQTSSQDGVFSVLLPFHFPSGVGSVAAVELQRPDGPIASASGPWRTNALFLFVLLGMGGMAVFGVTKLSAAAMSAPAQPEAPRQVPASVPTMRAIEVPQPGLREEAEARRLAEERARSAEERLALLQDQYRRSLEELQRFQQTAARETPRADAALEERALRAEAKLAALQQQVQMFNAERDRLTRELEEARSAPSEPSGSGEDNELLLREAEREAIGLRAELEGALTQLAVAQRELQAARTRSGDDTAAVADVDAAKAELDAANAELMRARDALEANKGAVAAADRELEDARNELRALRAEEQRAAMLEDELRSVRAELAGATASHRAELVEREASFEQKIRTTREEFQRQLEEIEGTFRGQLGQRETDLVGRITAAEAQAREAARELEAVRAQLEAAERDAEARERRLADAGAEIAARRAEVEAVRAEAATKVAGADEAVRRADETHQAVQSLRADLARAEETLAAARQELDAERERSAGVAGRTDALERERRALADRVEKQAAQLEDAVTANSELNRKLQEVEARRQLELADDQGRAHIDELLRATQERLAGQTEKLMAAEDRVRELEGELTNASERLDVVEGELRTHQMSDALREIRGEHDADEVPVDGVIEDRRASAPFTRELTLDAKKSLARIMGITQLMKHKKDTKDQAQLIKQLTAFARRLDHTVADLADADRLARGTVELEIKRTDLEALIQRVVEESAIRGDHDVRIDAESFVIGIDPLRTEQILSGLLRTSGDRTGAGKEIVVRLSHADGGALLSVEDPEPSSDASLSPVVKRFAEVQGGWAKVESRDGGGSAFRIFLPEQRAASEPVDGPEIQIVVDEPQGWDPSAGQALSQELRRLAELPVED